MCYGLSGAQKEVYCIKVCMRQNRGINNRRDEGNERQAARMTQISGFRG